LKGDGFTTQQGLSGEGENKKTLKTVVINVKNLNNLISIKNLDFIEEKG